MLKNKWLTVIALTLFSLCAVMFAGCTLEGSIETLRAKAAGEIEGAPNAPTDVTASATSSSSITVSWSSVSGATSYNIYRSLSGNSGTFEQVGSSNSISYMDTGLSANTPYYYKVAAVNSYGEGPQSAGFAPATTSSSGGGFTDLTSNIWHDDSLSPNAVHQYRLYASSASVGYDYYILWEDVDNSSYTADIKVGVKREGYSTYFVVPTDYGNTSQQNCIELYISWSGYYIIEVQGHDSSSSGSYSIAYNDYGHP